MTCSEIHQDDIGTKLSATIADENNTAIDISSATAKQLVLQKPDGTTLTKTASFETDGSDGVIYYITQSGDLDTVGLWKIQGIVTVSSNVWHSDLESFKVHRNL